MQRKRELNEKQARIPSLSRSTETQGKIIQAGWEASPKQSAAEGETGDKPKSQRIFPPTQLPKRTVNQQTSPIKPFSPGYFPKPREESPGGILRNQTKTTEKQKLISPSKENGKVCNGEQKGSGQLDKRKGVPHVDEERIEEGARKEQLETEPEKLLEEDVTVKFPNLVDSVRVAEDRLSFTQKGIRKSLKYIFPTTYIGNSTTSQSAVITSNSVNSLCKIGKKPEWMPLKTQPTPYSGIPVPTNGRSAGLLVPIPVGKKLPKEGEKKRRSPLGESDPKEAFKSAGMTESMYVDDGKGSKEQAGETGVGSSSVGGATPSEGDDGLAAANRMKAKEPQKNFK